MADKFVGQAMAGMTVAWMAYNIIKGGENATRESLEQGATRESLEQGAERVSRVATPVVEELPAVVEQTREEIALALYSVDGAFQELKALETALAPADITGLLNEAGDAIDGGKAEALLVEKTPIAPAIVVVEVVEAADAPLQTREEIAQQLYSVEGAFQGLKALETALTEDDITGLLNEAGDAIDGEKAAALLAEKTPVAPAIVVVEAAADAPLQSREEIAQQLYSVEGAFQGLKALETALTEDDITGLLNEAGDAIDGEKAAALLLEKTPIAVAAAPFIERAAEFVVESRKEAVARAGGNHVEFVDSAFDDRAELPRKRSRKAEQAGAPVVDAKKQQPVVKHTSWEVIKGYVTVGEDDGCMKIVAKRIGLFIMIVLAPITLIARLIVCPLVDRCSKVEATSADDTNGANITKTAKRK